MEVQKNPKRNIEDLLPIQSYPSYNEGKNANPNQRVLASISPMVESEEISPNTPSPNTKLDIHANIIVLGKICIVFNKI